MSWSLSLRCPESRKDILVAEMWERGATGIVEEDGPGESHLRVFFEEKREDISQEFGGEWRMEENRDWVSAWCEAWCPQEVGERLFLIPDWMDNPTPPGRVRIETHPGRAYGTGTSEATQLALIGLERHLRPGDRALDVGTGTGILSVAALRLGAASVIACDIDPEAVEVADANIHRDEVSVGLFTGSVRSVRTASMDVIVANINAAAIIGLAAEWPRVLRRGGRLIVSGFLESDAGKVRVALRGIEERDKLDKNTWACMVFEN